MHPRRACRAKSRHGRVLFHDYRLTRKRPRSLPFSGLISQMPIPKPARSIKLMMSCACNKSASNSMSRVASHLSN